MGFGDWGASCCCTCTDGGVQPYLCKLFIGCGRLVLPGFIFKHVFGYRNIGYCLNRGLRLRTMSLTVHSTMDLVEAIFLSCCASDKLIVSIGFGSHIHFSVQRGHARDILESLDTASVMV